MHIFVVASSPPTTSPKPTTTETPSRFKDIWGSGDFNNSVFGNPSSLTIHLADKGILHYTQLPFYAQWQNYFVVFDFIINCVLNKTNIF